MKFERFLFSFAIISVLGAFLFFSTTGQASNGALEANNQASPDDATGLSALINSRQLVFSDEFNDSKLDNSKWATCYDWRLPSESGCTNHGNAEEQWYIDDQVKIQDGQLVITAEKRALDVAVQKQLKTFRYMSGMVNSGSGSTDGKIRWTGTYGYYEAKMKFQKGQGIWPAFWLLPVDKQWPPELDVMEFIGSKPHEILQTVHWEENNKPLKSTETVKGKNTYSDDWHTYGVDWREDGIDWYIDGEKTRSYTGPNIPNEPMEIIINLAVGGLLPGNTDQTTPVTSALQIDYVRVYQAKDQIRPYQH